MNKELEGKVVCFTIKKPKYQKLYIPNEEDVDTIVINGKEYKCSDIVKYEKALEIIKNTLKINDEDFYHPKGSKKYFFIGVKVTKEQYKLLKEVL